ncbi:Cyclic di-GMP phosphodiesterase response regulator RpfG [Aquisphaera giovannonii]|uniref:Cyclic di-GMP phosphodiesterase response regulator RpfG n=2 Tax=Aquisphaera giovannonii TaxID=406548 RepID=A0A5B9W007_9BACT|nr:Cyclic di-GMP phosphodiesterase response regulator RpfG [Aquisphaera giovannonii]
MSLEGLSRITNRPLMEEVPARRACGGRSDWASGIAELAAREFGAAVGIFDRGRRRWLLALGVRDYDLPEVRPELLDALDAPALRQGRASVWHPEDDPGRAWLLLPLSAHEGSEVVLFAGFRSSRAAELAASPGDPGATSLRRDELAWGPACPEPALRAWGQEFLARLKGTPYHPASQQSGPAAPDDEQPDRAVISRLIRRMRVSDPPARFQSLATNVLRSSLRVAAVAWLPAERDGQGVVSGSIEGLHDGALRRIAAQAGRDAGYLFNDAPGPHPGRGAGALGRYACMPAGSAGWLIAMNPLDDRLFDAYDVDRMQFVASLISTQSSNARIHAELKELVFGIILALSTAIDAKDPYTSGHSERVARIAMRLAEELGFPPDKRSDLYLAGLLHDIGKIGVDDVVLKKEGPLSPEEYRKIQAHVEIGVTILRDLKTLHHILPGVRHHHESLDGSGYPDHLSGEDIPLEARILAVADSFDAMSSNRPYRKRLTPGQIDEVLKKGRGKQWDARVVDALFACRMDVEAIRQKGLGESLVGAVDHTLGRH